MVACATATRARGEQTLAAAAAQLRKHTDRERGAAERHAARVAN